MRPWTLILGALFSAVLASGQTVVTLSCQATANPPVVRAEGLTERTGDINLNCFGGQPNALIAGNLSIFLNVSISNRTFENGTTDAILLVDNGTGFVPANVPPRPGPSNSMVWAGLQIRLSNEGKVNLRMQNVRGAASQLNPNTAASIVATLAFNAGALVSFLSNGFSVGTVQRGLYASNYSQLVCSQVGSPSPYGLTVTSAVTAGTIFSTVRVTEGFPSAFAPASDFSNQRADSGHRIILRYSGLPAGARIFVPNIVAGRDAIGPTSAGDFGYPLNGGQFQYGSGNLVLMRVFDANPNGGGGIPLTLPSQFAISFADDLSEIAYTEAGASGYAVYEVIDSDNTRMQSALIPSFLDLLPNTVDRFATIREDVLLASLAGPGETRTGASAHVPRFVSNAQVLPDCNLLGDCSAFYFPRLAVNQNAIEVVADNGRSPEYRYLYISNSGSGNLVWTTSVTYTVGASNTWLRLYPSAGVNAQAVQLEIAPAGLIPRTYEAEVLVDAGQFGKWTTRVTLRVTPGPPPTPVISSVTNPALRQPGPLVAGSLALIQGTRFSTTKIEVLFNGASARVVTSSPEEILVRIAPELRDLNTANVTVISEGVSSPSYYAYFADSAPAIFENYILNANASVNSETQPTLAGRPIQIFATGLPWLGAYSATIHDRERLQPTYAGQAPGLIGMQMVQVTVPADLPTMMSEVRVCGGLTEQNQTCSPARPLYIVGAPTPE